ncbi:MAG: thrombospondin type 3 repeat-containing protein [Paludibacter sp.]|nr:thrombospondin type 3 repeat-containing protein [Paludibacter sp.]
MKRNQFKKAVSILIIAVSVLPVMAQYPIIPDSVKTRAARQTKECELKSDIAWEKALPIVEKEEKSGRPYKPWASKPEDLLKADIPAFPGAEGGGAFTAGGRNGKVIVVNTLAEDGHGSFREACETGGARIIVFNVSGIIRLTTPIHVRAPYLTIAGQTAPGDGICVTGSSFLIDTHDVILRHMRFRRGVQDVAFRDDAIGGNPIGNIMIDHCSASWGLDENMSIYRHVYERGASGKGLKLPTVNVTIQNSIFSEALDAYNHAFGSTCGGHNCMFTRNLYASNISRNCSIGMDEGFNFVNNVIFNWWNRSVDGGDHKSLYNIINNYFKPGPITPLDKPISYRILKPEAGRDKNKPLTFGKAFVSGNIVEGNDKVTKNNWDGGVQLSEEVSEKDYLPGIRVNKPFAMPPVTIMETKQAYKFVLENAGADFPKRDAVDTRVVKTVQTGKAIYVENAPEFVPNYVKRRLPVDSYKKGIITDIRQVGGLPEYKGQPYLDSDNDGMPDAWEKANGLNPNDPTDAVKDCNGDGYTNIEKYINGIDTKKKVDWKNLKNNHDTLAGRKSL